MGQGLSTKRLRSPQEGYSKTRVNVNEFTFTWEIENFSHCPQQMGQEFQSSTFTIADSKVKWCLRVYVRGWKEESKDYVSVFLNPVETDGNNVGAKFRISLKGDTKEKSYAGYELQHHLFTWEGGYWGFDKFIKRSYLLDPKNGLLPEDKLTIVCSLAVAVAGDAVTVAGHVPIPYSGLNKVEPCIDHEFGEFVTLSVGEKQFNVYKRILSAHSPVLSAMFNHNTKESQTGHLQIKDTDPEVMISFLHFLYTGSAPNLKSMADRLLVLADKYQVQPLKLICEEALREQLSVENACAVLVQADRLSATQLKSYAVKFMIAQATAVSKSEGFKSLVEQYPQLLIETFQTMASNKFKLK